MKTIQRLAKGKFKVSTPGVANSEIQLDFNPLIDTFELSKGRQDYKLHDLCGTAPKTTKEESVA